MEGSNTLLLNDELAQLFIANIFKLVNYCICISIYLSTYMYEYLYLSIYLSLSVYLSIYLSLCLSIYLSCTICNALTSSKGGKT